MSRISQQQLSYLFFEAVVYISAFSALTLLVGWQEEHLALKKLE